MISTDGFINGDTTSGVSNALVCTSELSTNKYLGNTRSFLDLVEANPSSKSYSPPKPPLPTPALPDWLSEALLGSASPTLKDKGEDDGDQYIPMRDLFQQPSVSFAYERGWRQGFAAAGFPGIAKEYKMVKTFFEDGDRSVVVDMSCGTGLMARRFALNEGNGIDRVIACDYSPSMLLEARSKYAFARRRKALRKGNQGSSASSSSSSSSKLPRFDLVRVDVANLPMRSSSVGCLHAGAAMHCWPDVSGGLREIYRTLQPGGLFFASTFLGTYFKSVGMGNLSTQNFQLFKSKEGLRQMVVDAGFDDVDVSIIEPACVIIKAKKRKDGDEEPAAMNNEDDSSAGGSASAAAVAEEDVKDPVKGAGGMADTRDPETREDDDVRKSISAAPTFEEYMKMREGEAKVDDDGEGGDDDGEGGDNDGEGDDE